MLRARSSSEASRRSACLCQDNRGAVDIGIFGPVLLLGRSCSVDVTEVADECPVLIGYVSVEPTTLSANPKVNHSIGNPEHGGEFMIDMF